MFRCTERDKCDITHMSYGWLSYPYTQCPLIVTAEPPFILQYQRPLPPVSPFLALSKHESLGTVNAVSVVFQKIKLVINNLPQLDTSDLPANFLQCQVSGSMFNVTTNVVRTDSDVTCQDYSAEFPPLPPGVAQEPLTVQQSRLTLMTF